MRPQEDAGALRVADDLEVQGRPVEGFRCRHGWFSLFRCPLRAIRRLTYTAQEVLAENAAHRLVRIAPAHQPAGEVDEVPGIPVARQEVEQSESARGRVAELQQRALDAEADAERAASDLKAERRAERQRAETPRRRQGVCRGGRRRSPSR